MQSDTLNNAWDIIHNCIDQLSEAYPINPILVALKTTLKIIENFATIEWFATFLEIIRPYKARAKARDINYFRSDEFRLELRSKVDEFMTGMLGSVGQFLVPTSYFFDKENWESTFDTVTPSEHLVIIIWDTVDWIYSCDIS